MVSKVRHANDLYRLTRQGGITVDQECPTLQSLSDRLQNLERENRTLKRWGVAGLLALVIFVAMGATQNSQTLTAQKLVITDASNNPRAVYIGGWPGIAAFSWWSHRKYEG